MKSDKKIIVLGGGISGLSTAYMLHKKGYEVVVLEKGSEVGGMISTTTEKDCIVEKGVTHALELTPIIGELTEELKLKDDLLYASDLMYKKYIYLDGVMHPVPLSATTFFKSELFSTNTKLKVMNEPFTGKSKNPTSESIADFVRRRLGKEIFENAFDAFVAEAYYGDPEKLSAKYAFPKLFALEEKYGGLLQGAVKSIKNFKKAASETRQSGSVFTFAKGFSSLTNAIAGKLGHRVITHADVLSVNKNGEDFVVSYNHAGQVKTVEGSTVVSTVPAYIAADLVDPYDHEAALSLKKIEYPQVITLYLGFTKKYVTGHTPGYGFTIPHKAKSNIVNVVYISDLFPSHSTEEIMLFSVTAGGTRNKELFELSREEIIKKITLELREMLHITASPSIQSFKIWNKFLPQYSIEYKQQEEAFSRFETNNPGFLLSGNFRNGITLSDCLSTAQSVSDSVERYITS